MINPETIMIDDQKYVREDSVKQTVIKVDKTDKISSAAIGMKVLVRSRNEGINAGIVEAADETGVILKDARRLWYHRPKENSASWYEGVALYGVSANSKVSSTVSRKFIVEDYSIVECTEDAFESIMEKTPHAQG